MNFIQKYNQAYNAIINNKYTILEDLEELKNINQVETSIENADKNDKQKSKKQKPNAKIIIERIESLVKENERFTKVIISSLLSILTNMKDNLLDSEGDFLKVGVLRWKNIPKYAEFAKFVKSTVEDTIYQLNY